MISGNCIRREDYFFDENFYYENILINFAEKTDMSRRRQPRKIVAPPAFKGYKPFGVSETNGGPVELLYEEYEALKLADYDMMTHHEACKLMDISRPTFARIYESARRKIAKALVETKQIRCVYGNAYFEDTWYQCRKCKNLFTMPDPGMDKRCPLCGAEETELINEKI